MTGRATARGIATPPVLLAVMATVGIAHAQAPDAAGRARRFDLGPDTAPPRRLGGRPAYVHLLGGAAIGRGLRLNNPFRLTKELGESGESLSLSATYADLAAGLTLGDPDGLQHGGALRWSASLDGIPQHVVSPGYLLVWRALPALAPFARVSVPIVLLPDANAGGEVGIGAAWYFRAAAALTAEIGYAIFHGAATPEVSHTVIPIVSAQFGILVDYEVLP